MAMHILDYYYVLGPGAGICFPHHYEINRIQSSQSWPWQ
jgi:hypothetical protein